MCFSAPGGAKGSGVSPRFSTPTDFGFQVSLSSWHFLAGEISVLSNNSIGLSKQRAFSSREKRSPKRSFEPLQSLFRHSLARKSGRRAVTSCRTISTEQSCQSKCRGILQILQLPGKPYQRSLERRCLSLIAIATTIRLKADLQVGLKLVWLKRWKSDAAFWWQVVIVLSIRCVDLR